MDFVSNKARQQIEMLADIGVGSFEELLSSIPKQLLKPAPKIDDGLSEAEGFAFMEKIADQNGYLSLDSYLGAGAYSHHIPAIVGAITSRSEFMTAYTPYQAEASQGLLQVLFEYQTAICRLTGMDAANASVYDGASACAEACLMAVRSASSASPKIALSSGLHPLYRRVVEQYLIGNAIEIDTFGPDVQELKDDYAGVLVQSPNFFGSLERLPKLNSGVKILCGNPLSYGLYTPPGDKGADIAVGDLQPLGLPLSFGGPYAGYMACKESFIRKLPGRIAGKTVDAEGKPGFVLTLQAREQHIRREKATSNICTNQALSTLASLVTILWYGPEGLKNLALTNYRRAHYLYKALLKLPGFRPFSKGDFFNEFTVELPCSAEEALEKFRNEGIEPGLPLSRFYPEMKRHLLVAVTELKDKNKLDLYIEIARKL